MTEIALITGASSGLGREFAMQISRSEERPQEIWAVARRENRLEELQKLCGIPVRPIPLDLTRQESIRKLEELLQKEKPVIRILVNAAGFGKIGRYSEISREDTDRPLWMSPCSLSPICAGAAGSWRSALLRLFSLFPT